jgi:hypothetical protein
MPLPPSLPWKSSWRLLKPLKILRLKSLLNCRLNCPLTRRLSRNFSRRPGPSLIEFLKFRRPALEGRRRPVKTARKPWPGHVGVAPLMAFKPEKNDEFTRHTAT